MSITHKLITANLKTDYITHTTGHILKKMYIHSINMTVNLKIGYNNKFITNSTHTNFLGMTMINTLSWNNHTDSIVKKLSRACNIIRNAKTCMSVSSLRMIYYAFFHSVMSYGIIFWGNSSHSSTIF